MRLRLEYQLLFYYIVAIVIVTMGAIALIRQQTKDIGISMQQRELILLNKQINDTYVANGMVPDSLIPPGYRVSIIDTNFNIIYDNTIKDVTSAELSSYEEEIEKSAEDGEFATIKYANVKDLEYLYYAKEYNGYYIRTVTKYNADKAKVPLRGNQNTTFAFIALAIILVIAIFHISQKISKPLKVFNKFINALKSNEKDFSNIKFPHNEYGDVGQIIVDTFDQLEKTKLYKQQMSHNIAHELKTPVTGIRGYLETIIHDENMDLEQIRRFAEKAYNQTIRLSSLINDVSTLNQIEEGRHQYLIEDVNIASCINDVKEELNYKLKQSNIHIDMLISSELSLKGSYQLIYSLFKNLIDNTIEHGGKDTSIIISAGIRQKSGDDNYRVVFTYTDTGKCVPPESIERLFERFYRIEQGRTRKTGGSGLGLAIVKNVVLFHKGSITVENREGGGLIFKFNLCNLS